MLPSWASGLLVASTLASVTMCVPTYPPNKRQSTAGIVTGIDSRDQNGTKMSLYGSWALTLRQATPSCASRCATCKPTIRISGTCISSRSTSCTLQTKMTRFHTMDLPVSFIAIQIQSQSDLCGEGIHGRPYKPVLDAPGIPTKIGHSGYCPHSMALFLGWHRPYLALFEVRNWDFETPHRL
jgi:tyrosinase